MFEHVFAKKISERMKENYEKVFRSLEPVSKMKPHRYELPITSIRRILGDDFYKMENTNDDLLNLVVFDNGGFNIEEFKVNIDKASELIQYISIWFQGFVEANGYSTVFTPEFMDRKVAKVCITSTKGLKTREICLNDLKTIALFGDNGAIVGMKNIKEISQISTELQKNDQAYRQMEQTGNQQGIQAIQSQRNEYLQKLSTYQVEVVDEFFELIKEWSGEDLTEVFDVAIIFGVSAVSEDGKTTISQTSLYDYHDGASKTVMNLERKFGLDIPDFEKEMSE